MDAYYILEYIILPMILALLGGAGGIFLILKRSSSKTPTNHNVEDSPLIKSFEKRITEVEKKVSAYHLDVDKVTNEVSYLKGIIKGIVSKL